MSRPLDYKWTCLVTDLCLCAANNNNVACKIDCFVSDWFASMLKGWIYQPNYICYYNSIVLQTHCMAFAKTPKRILSIPFKIGLKRQVGKISNFKFPAQRHFSAWTAICQESNLVYMMWRIVAHNRLHNGSLENVTVTLFQLYAKDDFNSSLQWCMGFSHCKITAAKISHRILPQSQ